MKEIRPVQIITHLDDEEYRLFKEKIDRQFTAFAIREFGDTFDYDHHKWWATTNVTGQKEDTIDDGLTTNKDLPILTQIVGLYDARKFDFIFYANDTHFTKLIPFVKHIKNLKKQNQILGGIVDVFYYGICFFRNASPDLPGIKHANDQSSEFDILAFQSDINFHYANNPNGYHDFKISGTNDLDIEHKLDSAVLAMFHVTLTKDALYQSREQVTQVLMSTGIYSLTYEPDIYKHNVAVSLLLQMFPKFCIERKQKAWCDETSVNQYLQRANIDSKWGWKTTYKYFAENYESVTESETRNKEIIKVLYKPAVSPWSLFSQWLIPVYFRKYLKSLVANLRESAHSFMYAAIDGYSNHLEKRHKDVLSGDSDGAVVMIGKFLKNIWAENNKLEEPAGLQHVILVLDKVTVYLHEQAAIIDSLKDNRTPAGEVFPLLDDYPLKNIPKPLQKLYVDFAQHDVENQYLAKENDKEKSFEQIILSELVKLLQFHPVPLSLFLRAIILGIISPLMVFAGLLLIPDVVVNTVFFESGPGVVLLFVAGFTVAVISAFLKYSLGVIRKIKISIKKYMAWIFWKTQQKLIKSTLDQQSAYYHELITECGRIRINITGDSNTEKSEQNADGFIPVSGHTGITKAHSAFEKLKTTLFPEEEPKFAQGMFQRDILGKFDDELSILADGIVKVQIKADKTYYPLSSLGNENNQALLFKSLFLQPGISGSPLYQFFYERIIFYHCDKDTPDDYFGKIRQEFCAMLIEELKNRISLENAESIQELVFGNAKATTGHNFNKNVNNVYVNKLIQSRFYPSVLLRNSNPYSQLSFIIPSDNHYHDEEWAKVFSNGHLPNHVFHRKSMVSIMQSFSLNGLTDIFEEENPNIQNQQ